MVKDFISGLATKLATAYAQDDPGTLALKLAGI